MKAFALRSASSESRCRALSLLSSLSPALPGAPGRIRSASAMNSAVTALAILAAFPPSWLRARMMIVSASPRSTDRLLPRLRIAIARCPSGLTAVSEGANSELI